jgi:hypothetical protein
MRDHTSDGCPCCRKPELESLEPRLLLDGTVDSALLVNPNQNILGPAQPTGASPTSAPAASTSTSTAGASSDVSMMASSGNFDYTLPSRGGYNADGSTFAEGRNQPLGTGVGIYPGRVVWVHDPASTNSASGQTPWDQTSTTTYWWQNTFTNMSVVQAMADKGVMNLTGTTSVAAAWTALFNSFNTVRGAPRTDGYHAGEKIAIKVNLNTQNYQNNSTGNMWNWRTVTPQVVSALLNQLVNVVGVDPTNIYIYDDLKVWSKPYWDYYTGQTDSTLNSPQVRFPAVHWMDYGGNRSDLGYPTYDRPSMSTGDNGRNPIQLSSDTPITYPWTKVSSSTPAASPVPLFLESCKYIVDLAGMFGHEGAGVTLCGKNFIGSIGASPNAGAQVNGNGSGMNDIHNHNFFNTTAAQKMGGEGRTMAQFMADNDIGQKIVLFMLDGLYGGWDNGTTGGSVNIPQKWSMPPFGDGLQNGATAFPSSLFFSQDPVAIDSVGFDFLVTESTTGLHSGAGQTGNMSLSTTNLRFADDYLHEEAQIGHAPSGSAYDLSGANDAWLRAMGTSASLGTHEHWNSGYFKQYSRNLGKSSGIELVDVEANAPHITGIQFNGSKAVSTEEVGANGVTSIAVTFDQAVSLDANTTYDVLVQKVTFNGNIENVTSTVTPSSVVTSGTPTVLTINLPNGTDTDSWLKVTLMGHATVDGSMNMLGHGIVGAATDILMDGDPKAGGNGRGYIYSAADLTTGNAISGGNAVFYVGALSGDGNGDRLVDGLDYGVWQNGYRKPGPTAATGDYNGDGSVDGLDYGIWQNAYGKALAALPTALGGSSESFTTMADAPQAGAASAAPVAALVATVPTTDTDTPVAAAPGVLVAATVASAGTAAVPAIPMAPLTWVNAINLTPTTATVVTTSTGTSLAPDGGVDVLATPAIVLPLT